MACGNDIVDLQCRATLGKAADVRFVSRVLTPGEQRVLQEAGFPDRLLWLFWAAKEAAYKVVSHRQAAPAFIPGRFEVEFGEPRDLQLPHSPPGGVGGLVKTPGGEVPVKAEFTADYVHVVGADSPVWLARVSAGYSKFQDGGPEFSRSDESAQARRLALAALAPAMGVPVSQLEIKRLPTAKGLGPPLLYHRGKKAAADLSLSHHGRYVSYAFVMTCFRENMSITERGTRDQAPPAGGEAEARRPTQACPERRATITHPG